MTYLITGGAGFIGANFIKYILKKYEDVKVIILDKLTYAGNSATIKEELENIRVSFIKGDICDRGLVENIFKKNDVDFVVNFAAESHVDKSIEDPSAFLETNIIGTQTLLDVAKFHWSIGKDECGYPIYRSRKKFLQVSTDEVYGSLKIEHPDGKNLDKEQVEMDSLNWKKIIKAKGRIKTFGEKLFTEKTPVNPRNPYAASKTSADLLVKAYAETYRMPINISRCSNNYGPYQFPEKLIPFIIKNILEGKNSPIYGNGMDRLQ